MSIKIESGETAITFSNISDVREFVENIDCLNGTEYYNNFSDDEIIAMAQDAI